MPRRFERGGGLTRGGAVCFLLRLPSGLLLGLLLGLLSGLLLASFLLVALTMVPAVGDGAFFERGVDRAAAPWILVEMGGRLIQ